MKNLMIYISPTGSFNNPQAGVINDAASLVKIQIDNSLELGWKKEDILLITNFAYQYGPIKAKILKGIEFFDQLPRTTKIDAIIKLFDEGTIKNDQIYWFHDLDAFQLEAFSENEIDLTETDLALTDYGRYKRWNAGSFFFKSNAKDIFNRIGKLTHQKLIDEEKALGILMAEDEAIKKRIQIINRSYNFTAFNLKPSYKRAIKPIKVVHFHPLAEIRQLKIKKPLDYFKGDNYINTPLLTENLIKIFKFHRIR